MAWKWIIRVVFPTQPGLKHTQCRGSPGFHHTFPLYSDGCTTSSLVDGRLVRKRDNQLATAKEFIVRHAQSLKSFLHAMGLCCQYSEPATVIDNNIPSRVTFRFKLRMDR